MVAWGGLACLLTVLYLQIRADSRIWGSGATPGVLLTGGFTAVAAIYAFTSLVFDFNPIHVGTYIFLSIAGLLQIGVSFLTSSALGWRVSSVPPSLTTRSGAKLRFALMTLSAVYAYVAYGIASSAGGLWSSESMRPLGSGPIGHLNVLLACVLLWYGITTGDRKLLRFPLLALGLLVLSINPVKGWTLIPMMGIVLAEVSGQRDGRFKIAPLLIGCISGVLIFVLIYLARAVSEDTDLDALFAALGEISKHFVFYATAGFFGLDAVIEGLELHGSLAVLFAPFANIINLLQGEQLVGVISNIYIIGIQDGGEGGNVFSMYGSLIGYGGFFAGSLLGLAIITAAYLLRGIAWRSHGVGSVIASNYLCSILMFGWFDYYFFSLTPFEVFFYCALISLARYFLSSIRSAAAPDMLRSR